MTLAGMMEVLQTQITNCTRCARLRKHCTQIAAVKRAAFREDQYWGRPIPNFIAPGEVKLLIVGLAPAAHGANRTGRMFTGDRSGDFLFRAMHAAGFANQPTSVRAGDGLELIDCAITATCHCAPPDNKPTPAEVAKCRPFLDRTLELLPGVKGIVALGKIAFDASVGLLRRANPQSELRNPKFSHGALTWSDNLFLLGSYHPSQQNTFTGRLTQEMLTAVFQQARRLIEGDCGA